MARGNRQPQRRHRKVETIAIVTGGGASGSPLSCVKNLDRAGINAVPAHRLRERRDDGAGAFPVRDAQHGQQQLRERTPPRPRSYGLRMRAGGESEHQAQEIDAREQGVHGLDEARIDVDDERPLVGDNEIQRQRIGRRSNSGRVGSTTLSFSRSPTPKCYPSWVSAATPSDRMSSRQFPASFRLSALQMQHHLVEVHGQA